VGVCSRCFGIGNLKCPKVLDEITSNKLHLNWAPIERSWSLHIESEFTFYIGDYELKF
jgi:hypothetical protein